jgi:prepilin-type N-terminal cleavage/methylation domain-containing protein
MMRRFTKTVVGTVSETGRGNRRGFTLIELLVVIAIIALLIGILLPTLAEARKIAKLLICQTQLKNNSSGAFSYAADGKDALFSLQNYKGRTIVWDRDGLNQTISYPNNNAGELASVADDAVNIIRKRSGRTDIDRIGGWIATVLYNHLKLQDYLAQTLPSKVVACPEDRYLLAYQKDPVNYHTLGEPLPPTVTPQNGGQNNNKRWPYSTSYMGQSSWWSKDYHTATQGAWYFDSATTYARLGGVSPKGDIGGRLMTDVRFPGEKIMTFDRGSRHYTKKTIYWNFDDARQPFAFFDSSVRVKVTGDANRGWNYNNPRDMSATYSYSYNNTSTEWFPALRDGTRGSAGFQAAYFATTRGGLEGVDFGAAEPIWRR